MKFFSNIAFVFILLSHLGLAKVIREGMKLNLVQTCPLSVAVELILETYGCGNGGIPVKNGINCVCQTVNNDQMAVCTGSNLDFNATRYILFSGSQNLMDFIHDAEFLPVFDYTFQMNVHYGFHAKFLQWKPFIDLIMTNNTNGKTVLMGHSLGGAIARLATLYLKQNNYDVEIVTIGEPATCKKPFTETFKQISGPRIVNYRRYSGDCSLSPNSRDPAEFLTFTAGYEHAGPVTAQTLEQEIHFTDLLSCKTKSNYSHILPKVVPVVGDCDIALHLGVTYKKYTDAVQCN